MPISVVVSFVVVFALMLLAVSVGLKYFDARRKAQVAGMLETAAGESTITKSNALRTSRIRRRMASVSSKAEALLSEEPQLRSHMFRMGSCRVKLCIGRESSTESVRPWWFSTPKKSCKAGKRKLASMRQTEPRP